MRLNGIFYMEWQWFVTKNISRNYVIKRYILYGVAVVCTIDFRRKRFVYYIVLHELVMYMDNKYIIK